WTDVSKTLSKGRKKRKAPEELAPEATVASFAHGELHSFHRKDKAGVTSVHAHDSAPSLIVTGGVDHTVKVFDLAATRVVDTLAGHSKRITRALWHPDITAGSRIVSASKDGDVRLWSKGGEGAYDTAGTMTPHGGSEVMALEVHPSSDYLLTAAGGGAAGWSVTNAATGTVLGTFGADGPANTAASLHPDGLLYAVAGQDAGVRIFDLRSQAQVAAFEDATVAQNTLDFNENGRYMAGAGKDGQVGIWDLRKMGKVATMTAPGAVGAVAWDFSGSYLAAGSEDGGKGVVSVFKVKSWEQLLSTTAHAAAVTSLHWAPLATSLVSASMDNTVAKWGAAK
ncbi:PRP19B, partial [Symbiodinium sp. KB8]